MEDSEFQTKTASKGPLAIPILHIMVCNTAMMLVLGMSEHYTTAAAGFPYIYFTILANAGKNFCTHKCSHHSAGFSAARANVINGGSGGCGNGSKEV